MPSSHVHRRQLAAASLAVLVLLTGAAGCGGSGDTTPTAWDVAKAKQTFTTALGAFTSSPTPANRRTMHAARIDYEAAKLAHSDPEAVEETCEHERSEARSLFGGDGAAIWTALCES